MTNLSERIVAIQKQPALTDAVANEITAVFSDHAFLQLATDQQYAFLDFIHSLYGPTHHSTARTVAAALQNIFQSYLNSGDVPAPRLYKTYDLLYLLYWCAATSIEQQRDFDTGVVIPFSRYLSS